MGGLYISPNSSEISWKRRAARVTSEALLCLGVATVVASFVVETAPEATKPNIWILVGGAIIIFSASIGWALTFCLACVSEPNNIGSSRDPNAPIHSVEIRIPANVDEKIAHDYYITKARPIESGRTTVTDSPKTEKRTKTSKTRSKQKERREKRRERTKEHSRVETSSSSATSSDLTAGTEKRIVKQEKRKPRKDNANRV